MKKDSQDWRAVTSSTVFKEYVKNELEKEAELQAQTSKFSADDFIKFQSSIRKDAKLFIEFNKMQDKIIDDPQFRRSLEPKFVEAMLALDLTEGEI